MLVKMHLKSKYNFLKIKIKILLFNAIFDIRFNDTGHSEYAKSIRDLRKVGKIEDK